jgi:hypothetical protein
MLVLEKGGKRVHVGAIVSIPASLQSAAGSDGATLSSPIAYWNVLGASVLERMVERLRMFGVSEISVVRENPTEPRNHEVGPIKGGAESDAVVSRYLGYGLETLLLVRIGPYVELDVADFLRFHRETPGPVSEVYDEHGALDLWAINAAHLRQEGESFRGMPPTPKHYAFAGYANRLWDAHDFRQLAKDALLGRAGIRPIGKEIATNVWANENAWIDESARIVGPAYIGENSRVHAACTITGASSIEQQCEIDCGTIIDDCCVLPHTYLGMALTVRNAIACEQTLFHLGRNVQLQFRDRRLMGVFPERGLLAQARSFWSAQVTGPLNPYSQPTDSIWHL